MHQRTLNTYSCDAEKCQVTVDAYDHDAPENWIQGSVRLGKDRYVYYHACNFNHAVAAFEKALKSVRGH